jgi:protein-S-isoprenylcysteine O-methyltransferase Ste14
MQPQVGQDNVATAIFAVVFGGWIIFEILVTTRTRARGDDRKQNRASTLAVFGSIILAFLIMQAAPQQAPWAAIHWDGWLVFGIGIVLALAAFAFRLWAMATLGRFFTAALTTTPDQNVIQTGPYRFMRHPSYAAPLVIVLGAALTFVNWLSLAAVVPVFLAYCYRIRVEERLLIAELGSDYVDYCRRTKRLIPFIY